MDLLPEAAAESLFVEEDGREDAPRVSAPRVKATTSRLLYDVLAGLYTDLGFDAVGDAT